MARRVPPIPATDAERWAAVKFMRDYQIKFFANRSSFDQHEAMKYERIVDAILAERARPPDLLDSIHPQEPTG